MWRLLAIPSLALVACGGAIAEEALSAPAESPPVIDTLNAYEEAWSRHDAKAIAGFYFEPAMRISPKGPNVRATRENQETFFSGLISALVQQGYAYSKWERLDVHVLDANTALASRVIVRYRQDGGVFQRLGVTYGLWRSDQGWKIFLSTTHSPETGLRFR